MLTLEFQAWWFWVAAAGAILLISALLEILVNSYDTNEERVVWETAGPSLVVSGLALCLLSLVWLNVYHSWRGPFGDHFGWMAFVAIPLMFASVICTFTGAITWLDNTKTAAITK